MNENNVGNNKYLKRLNEMEIMNLIRVNKAISKAELSQKTGLSPTAVGIIVSGLTQKGYIHETGVGDSNGGRRPVLYELKPHSFYSIGVDIDVDYISAVLIDITGNIIHEQTTSMPEDISFEKAIGKVGSLVEEIIGEFSIDLGRFLGIGISVPGLVKNEIHKIVFAPNLNWRNVNIKEHIDSIPDVPVFVENEAKVSAICEKWLGCCKDTDNFVCINVRSGIGAGIFIDGKLYRGVGGSAGEVGHIVVEEEGPRCGCGNFGCLETVAATGWILEEVKKVIRKGTAPGLNNIDDVESVNLDQVVKAARAGDEQIKGVLVKAGGYIGIAAAYLTNTLNPSKIVIGKDFTKYSDIVLEHVKNIVSSKALKPTASDVEIMVSSIGEKSSAIGAAIIPLQQLFQYSTVNPIRKNQVE